MLPLIPLAIGLASKFIPELVSKALDSKEAGKVAKVIISEATKFAPDNSEQDALKAYEDYLAKNPAAVHQLHEQILKVVELEVKDVQHARVMGKGDDKLTYLIVILAFVGLGACIVSLVYVVRLNLEGGALATVSAAIGSVSTLCIQQLQQISNYKYGSSIGEKFKDLSSK